MGIYIREKNMHDSHENPPQEMYSPWIATIYTTLHQHCPYGMCVATRKRNMWVCVSHIKPMSQWDSRCPVFGWHWHTHGLQQSWKECWRLFPNLLWWHMDHQDACWWMVLHCKLFHSKQPIRQMGCCALQPAENQRALFTTIMMACPTVEHNTCNS